MLAPSATDAGEQVKTAEALGIDMAVDVSGSARGFDTTGALVTHVISLDQVAELLDGVTRREIPSSIKGVVRLG